MTASWPELAGLPDALPATTALLDGELVATDDDGRPSFGLLQQRMHVADPAEAARRAAEVPVTYVVFDLLHLDGHDLTGLPLTDRRRLLDQVLEPGPRWRCSPLHDDGPALLAAADRARPRGRRRQAPRLPLRAGQAHPDLAQGEGAPPPGDGRGRLAAGRGQPHRPHRRPPRRLPRRPGRRRRSRFAGRVGTGFKDAELERLGALFDDLATDECPFDPPPPRAEILRGPRWVRPELVAELEFGEWTGDGRLRHPSYLGLRDDKSARGRHPRCVSKVHRGRA